MIRFKLLLTFIVLSLNAIGQNYEMYITGDSTGIITAPTGGICMMGGATENDEAMKWFLKRADGGDVVVLRASGSDGYNNYFFSELGIPINSATTIVFNEKSASYDPTVIEKVSGAEAIWFAGGNQAKYIDYWRDTPVDSIIRVRISEGITIGGTSAGMAILGGYYFSAANGTIQSEQALLNPLDEKITIENASFIDLPLLSNVVTDTHFDDRDRSGRLVSFMANIVSSYDTLPFAIACEEYTSVCIDPSGDVWVYGDFPGEEDYAYFLSVNCLIDQPYPEQFQDEMPLTWDQNGQAIQALKVPGTPTGSYVFNMNDWIDNESGTWEYWWVEEGVLNKSIGSERKCEPLSSSLSNSVEIQIIPNPVSQNTFRIESKSKILSVEAFAIGGEKITLKMDSKSDLQAIVTVFSDHKIIMLNIKTTAGTIIKKLVHE
jgi:cyanophycinase